MNEQYKELKINIPFHLCEDLESMLCSSQRDESWVFVNAIRNFVEDYEFDKNAGLYESIEINANILEDYVAKSDFGITDRQKRHYQDCRLDFYVFDVPVSLYNRLEIMSKDIGFSINDVVVGAVGEAVDDYLCQVKLGYEYDEGFKEFMAKERKETLEAQGGKV